MVSDPEHIKRIEASGDVDRLHKYDTASLPCGSISERHPLTPDVPRIAVRYPRTKSRPAGTRPRKTARAARSAFRTVRRTRVMLLSALQQLSKHAFVVAAPPATGSPAATTGCGWGGEASATMGSSCPPVAPRGPKG